MGTPEKLETETCGRCGGSGRYSYNQIDGDLCYGCGGSGLSYTKRGAAALAFLGKLRNVRADSIKVGDVIRVVSLFASYFAAVVEVKPSTCSAGYLEIVTAHPTRGALSYHAPADAPIRRGFSKEEKAAQLARALEYQATLTKDGKPRKA